MATLSAVPPLGKLARRLDQRVLDPFKAGGAGWRTRVNDALVKTLDGDGA